MAEKGAQRLTICFDCGLLPAACLVLNKVGRDSPRGHVLQRKTLLPSHSKKRFSADPPVVMVWSAYPLSFPESFKETVEFRLELGIADRVTQLAQESEPTLGDKDKSFSLKVMSWFSLKWRSDVLRS